MARAAAPGRCADRRAGARRAREGSARRPRRRRHGGRDFVRSLSAYGESGYPRCGGRSCRPALPTLPRASGERRLHRGAPVPDDAGAAAAGTRQGSACAGRARAGSLGLVGWARNSTTGGSRSSRRARGSGPRRSGLLHGPGTPGHVRRWSSAGRRRPAGPGSAEPGLTLAVGRWHPE